MTSKLRNIQPEKAFLVLALIFGIAILCINPPFQVPDEQVHFYKSYALTDGQSYEKKLVILRDFLFQKVPIMLILNLKVSNFILKKK